MNALELAAVAALIAGVGFVAMWAVTARLGDVTPVDSLWGPTFAAIAAAALLLGAGDLARRALVFVLVLAWAARLSWHMARRWRREGHEDARYAAMRAARGARFTWWSLPNIFLLQAVIAVAVSAPILAAGGQGGPVGLGALGLAGAAIALAGLALEAAADAELAAFRADPANAGRTLRTGLWALSRHPNYLGEATFWWGLFLIAAETAVGAWSAIGPALLTFLLLKVSGVALSEPKMRAAKPDYADYAATTPAFLPWPRPRRGP